MAHFSVEAIDLLQSMRRPRVGASCFVGLIVWAIDPLPSAMRNSHAPNNLSHVGEIFAGAA